MTAVDTLFHALVDYAGPFPPAKLPLDEAVTEFVDHALSEERELLGGFVTTVASVPEVLAQARPHLAAFLERGLSFRIALVVPPAVSAEELSEAIAAVEAEEGAEVSAAELSPRSLAGWDELRVPLARVPKIACEVPAASDDLEPLLDGIAARGRAAKLRTGGIEPHLVPSVPLVASFLRACTERDLPYKCTAGLHHAWGAERSLTGREGGPVARMHGYLNVMTAGLALRQAGAEQRASLDLDALLGADGFEVRREDDGTLRLGELHIDEAAARDFRERGFQGFGSCSFREPIDELRAEGLIA